VTIEEPAAEVCTWTLLPGVDLVGYQRGGVVAVFYQLGPGTGRSAEVTARAWVAEELLRHRRASGLALTFGVG
jgi:hypothetical protein